MLGSRTLLHTTAGTISRPCTYRRSDAWLAEDSEQEPANESLSRHAGDKQDHGKASLPTTSISQTDNEYLSLSALSL